MPTRKTKIIFFTALSLVVLASVCFVLMYMSMNSLIGSTSIKEDQIKTEMQTVDSRNLMKKDLEANSAQIAELSNFMISADGSVDFVKTLESLTSENNLKIDVKNVASADISNNKVELLNVNTDVTGEWKNVEYFLEILENYPLKTTINKVSLNKITDNKIGGKKVSQWVGNFDFSVVKLK